MKHKTSNILDAINYIEVNLRNSMNIQDIAKASGISSWYFQRMFRSLTGDSVSKYIYSRRMTIAAEDILLSKPLIELSFELQYESQEAFTRAFKRYHGSTPGQYKKIKGKTSVRKLKITEQYLTQIHKGNTMTPQLSEINEFKIIGLTAQFNGAMAEHPNNHEIIPNLWKEFHRRISEVQNRCDLETYGLIFLDPEVTDPTQENLHENLIYLAGVKVSSFNHVPKGMTTYVMPQQKYAAFTHKGKITWGVN